MNHLERAYSEKSIFIRCGISVLYLVVILITFILQGIVGFIAMVAVYYVETGSLKGVLLDAQAMLVLMDKNIILATLLVPFAISLFFMLLLIKVIHKRTFSELLNGTKKIRWNRVWFGFVLWFGLMGIYTIVSLIIRPDDFTLQFNISQFIPLLIISLALLPLQTTFEEVMIRGYLAQGTGMLTKSRWLALLLPAFIFTLLHMANPEVGEYGLGIMLTTYFIMALVLGLTSILDDGIELAMGMHAANNIFISLFASQQGAAFETYAVFQIAKSNPYIALLELVVMGAILLVIFHKKYDWSFNKLNKKIESPDEINV